MSKSVIIDDAAARRILNVSGIKRLRSGTQLHDVAIWLDDIAWRFIRLRETEMLDRRGRLRVMMGSKVRKRLYENLVSVWEHNVKGRYPPVTRYGRFMRFTGAFCDELSSYLTKHPASGNSDTWRKIIRNFQKIRDDESGEQVRDGLRLIERDVFRVLGKKENLR